MSFRPHDLTVHEGIAGFMQRLLWCGLTLVHCCGAVFGPVNK